MSAINIGFVGIAQYDIIGHLARGTFGDVTTGSRIVFTLVGIAGLSDDPLDRHACHGSHEAREEPQTSDAWLMTGWLALLIATLGALNWGFIGIAKYDVVGAIAGLSFGTLAAGNRIPFTVIGISGLVLIPFLVSLLSGQLSLVRPRRVRRARKARGRERGDGRRDGGLRGGAQTRRLRPPFHAGSRLVASRLRMGGVRLCLTRPSLWYHGRSTAETWPRG